MLLSFTQSARNYIIIIIVMPYMIKIMIKPATLMSQNNIISLRVTIVPRVGISKSAKLSDNTIIIIIAYSYLHSVTKIIIVFLTASPLLLMHLLLQYTKSQHNYKYYMHVMIKESMI